MSKYSHQSYVLCTRRGKYDIAFAFRVRRGIAASLFTVEPSKGVVAPGQAAEVCVTFCSREEVHLKVRVFGGGWSCFRVLFAYYDLFT